MGIEIERKFLLAGDGWRAAAVKSVRMAQGYIKLSMKSGLAGSLAQGLAQERANQSILLQSADAQEGIKSFFEKRAPNFPLKPSRDMPPFGPWAK